MKATDSFKTIISNHLQKLADKDPLFAKTLKKENKNLDDCVTYILNQVKASGCNGFADEEIFGMAVHYYDEDNINVGAPINCKVVVNHKPELSEEDMQKAKDEAYQKIVDEEKEKLKKKASKKSDLPVVQQASLF